MRETLPKGWIISSLGNVSTHPQYGWTCRSNKKGAIKLLRTTDVSNGKINWEQVPFCEKEPDNVDKYILKVNDILVSRAGSVGISYRISKDDLAYKTVFASYLIRFCPYNPASFVAYYFKSHQYWQFISDTQLGIAVPNVNATKLSKLPIPLPPLNEQKRIVAKLDAIIPRIDLLKARLDKIPALIKRFRQSVLTAAVTGKLTETWREEHPEVESADLLLEKIKNERKSLKRKHKTGYSFKTDFHIDERYISLTIPNSWEKTNIDLVSLYIVDCPHSTPKWADSGHICLRTTNFLSNKLNLSEVRYVSKDTYKKRIERLKPEKGDVLYSREGGILGIACILNSDEDVCLGQRMMMFRTSKNIITEYFSFYLNSPIFLQHVKNLIGGSAAPHINIRDIKKYPFPLPPLEEQKEIVRQVDKFFTLADKLEVHYQKAKTRIDKLSQSVLAKAFRGELTPQDPNDEPAEKLLERIMAEKAKMESALKGSKKKGGGQKAKAGSRELDEKVVSSILELTTQHGAITA